jgi:hypothetical protein
MVLFILGPTPKILYHEYANITKTQNNMKSKTRLIANILVKGWSQSVNDVLEKKKSMETVKKE